MTVFEKLLCGLESLEDPRVLGRTSHKFINVLAIGSLAIICGSETWVDMEHFGKGKMKWLKKFLDLKGGIPSHDTFARVFSIISTEQMGNIFTEWVNSCRKAKKNDVIGVDGKTLRGTVETKLGVRTKCLHLVNAWSVASGLVLGQKKSSGSGNCEATAAKELLAVLDIKGSTIVCDAGVGRKNFLERVLQMKANYICPIKANPKVPYERVVKEFTKYSDKKSRSKKVKSMEETVETHGRKERRYCTIIRKENYGKELFKNTEDKDYFPGVEVIGKIVYEVEEKETRPYIQEKGDGTLKSKYTVPTNEIRKKRFEKYFITSLKASIEEIFRGIRLQWAIENNLHWALDVSLGEDANRTKDHTAAQNLSIVRKIALNLAKSDHSKKIGVKAKLKLAGWDEEYLEHLLFSQKLDGVNS